MSENFDHDMTGDTIPVDDAMDFALTEPAQTTVNTAHLNALIEAGWDVLDTITGFPGNEFNPSEYLVSSDVINTLSNALEAIECSHG